MLTYTSNSPALKWGEEMCIFVYINCELFDIFSYNSYDLFFQQIVLCSMLPLVRGNFEHRSKWLVPCVLFELTITYKGKIKGIIFNLSTQILTPHRWIYIHSFLFLI